MKSISTWWPLPVSIAGRPVSMSSACHVYGSLVSTVSPSRFTLSASITNPFRGDSVSSVKCRTCTNVMVQMYPRLSSGPDRVTHTVSIVFSASSASTMSCADAS